MKEKCISENLMTLCATLDIVQMEVCLGMPTLVDVQEALAQLAGKNGFG